MNLDKKVTGLDGSEAGINYRDVVCSVLTQEKNSDPVRAYSLAMDIFNKKEKLNASDIDFVTAAVKGSQAFLPIAVGQVLQELAKFENKTK